MDFYLLSLSDPAKRNAPAPPLAPSDYPLNLLLDWHSAESKRQILRVGTVSAIVHAIALLLALKIPGFVQPSKPELIVIERRTPLYFPRELTQKAPNKGKISKDIDLASLAASQQQQQRQRAAPNPSVRNFAPPQTSGVAQQNNKNQRILADAPNLALNQAPGDVNAGASNGLPPAPPAPAATPSPFQNAGAIQAPPKPAQPKVPPPPGTLRPAPTPDNQTIPALPSPSLEGQLGNQLAAIELPSDASAPDFRQYLEKILAIVRANWQRVMPAGVRQGHMRGRSVIQFTINRDGSIGKVVVMEPSGVNQLDYTSSASIIMSSPLPQLPADYKGMQVKVSYRFDYNMPIR